MERLAMNSVWLGDDNQMHWITRSTCNAPIEWKNWVDGGLMPINKVKVNVDFYLDDPDLLIDKESLEEEFGGSWLELMNWFGQGNDLMDILVDAEHIKVQYACLVNEEGFIVKGDKY